MGCMGEDGSGLVWPNLGIQTVSAVDGYLPTWASSLLCTYGRHLSRHCEKQLPSLIHQPNLDSVGLPVVELAFVRVQSSHLEGTKIFRSVPAWQLPGRRAIC